MKTCDEVFAEYLNYVAIEENTDYCKKAVVFCLLYRECMNRNSKFLEEERKNLPHSLNTLKELSARSRLSFQILKTW